MQINGPALKAIRLKIPGLTITAASAAVGVSQPTWSNWERGKRNASAENVAAVAELLALDDVRAIVYAPPSELIALHELLGAA